MAELDLWYINNCSIWLDLKIILMTVVRNRNFGDRGTIRCDRNRGSLAMSAPMQSFRKRSGGHDALDSVEFRLVKLAKEVALQPLLILARS